MFISTMQSHDSHDNKLNAAVSLEYKHPNRQSPSTASRINTSDVSDFSAYTNLMRRPVSSSTPPFASLFPIVSICVPQTGPTEVE